jgi:hypothetical protein
MMKLQPVGHSGRQRAARINKSKKLLQNNRIISKSYYSMKKNHLYDLVEKMLIMNRRSANMWERIASDKKNANAV